MEVPVDAMPALFIPRGTPLGSNSSVVVLSAPPPPPPFLEVFHGKRLVRESPKPLC